MVIIVMGVVVSTYHTLFHLILRVKRQALLLPSVSWFVKQGSQHHRVVRWIRSIICIRIGSC